MYRLLGVTVESERSAHSPNRERRTSRDGSSSSSDNSSNNGDDDRQSQVGAPLQKSPASGTQAGTRSVAVVDDKDELCSLVAIFLRRSGYKVECIAHDGDEIVEAIAKARCQPDLILMDYRMPRMNGLDAAEEILKVNPRIKIIMLTASESIREMASSAGLGFIQKPFSLSTLSRVLEENLRD